jgi:tetratricopeptide (TPR) repeat protein
MNTADVIKNAFGLQAAEYDARFRAWAMMRLARYGNQYLFDARLLPLDEAHDAVSAAPQSAPAHVVYALALLRSHKPDEARRELDEALKVDPQSKDAHFVYAKLGSMTKDPSAVDAHLRALLAAGGDGYGTQMAIAEAADARHDKAAYRAALEAAHRLDPTQVDPSRALYDLAVDEKRDLDALAALRDVAHLDQHDRKAWRLLLTKLVQSKSWGEARNVGEAAIFVDVHSAAIHTDYARALAAGGDHAGAGFELESALLCDAKPDEQATAHALLAREKLALGDAASARQHRAEALRLDPQNQDARALPP